MDIIVNEVFNELNLVDVKEKHIYCYNIGVMISNNVKTDSRPLKIKYAIATIKYSIDNLHLVNYKKDFINTLIDKLKEFSIEQEFVVSVPYNQWLTDLSTY